MEARAHSQYASPYGSHALWRFLAPPGTTIRAFNLWWAGSTLSEIPEAATKALVTWGDQGVEHGNTGFGNPGNAFDPVNRVSATDLDRTSMYAFLACTRGQGCLGDGNALHQIGYLRIYKSEVELRDAISPSGTASGSAVSADSWAGAEGVTVNAEDEGGGVHRALVEVDGSVVAGEVLDTADGRCVDADGDEGLPHAFVDVRPCPLRTATDFTFDTTGLADGARLVRIFVEDAAGNRGLIAGPFTRTVDNVPPPQVTRRPAVTGSPKSGSSLAGDEGAWIGSGVAHTFQWQRCEADGATCSDIAGATGRSYTASDADAGKKLRLRVRATNSEGSSDAFSDPTTVVAASEGEPATVSRGGDGSSSVPSAPGAPATAVPAGTPNGENASPLAVLDARESGTDRRVLRVRYGRSSVIAGRLVAPGGVPIVAAKLDVVSQDQAAGAPLVALGDAATDATGRFRFVLGPGASRTVRFGYRARIGDIDYAQATEVQVRVVAKVTFRLSKKTLRNGKTLRYLGKIHGPRTGHRFAEVQVKQGRKWIVVCSVRTDARGSFACAHRFTRTYRKTKYRFRARVRRQTGLPYEPAVSAVRSTVVRPR